MRRLVPVVGLLTLLSLASTGPQVVHAGEQCVFDPVLQRERCVITLDPIPPLVVAIGGGGPGARLPLEWRRVFFANTTGGTDWSQVTCGRWDAGGNLLEIGAIFVVTLTNTETGEQLYLADICVLPSEPLPAPPPPAPSPGEFREAAEGLLRLDTLLNPRAEFGGVTGVDTWLWCADPGAVAVSVGPLRGWTASASMSPVEFYWRVDGEEAWSDSATSCGSEADPPATWMPERMGDYTVTGGATWAGTWTLSWNGIVLGTFVLGPFDFDSAPVAYPVDEFVGELKPDPRTR